MYCADLLRLIDTVDAHPPPTPPASGEGSTTSPVDELLDDLATGHGSASTLALLAATQLSITRALLAACRDGSGTTPAWELLVHLDQAVPEAVRAVLAHPFVRPGLVHRLQSSALPGLGAAVDPLPALAIAAALRAGVSAALNVPVRADTITFPALGSLVLPGLGESAEVTVRPGEFQVQGGSVEQTVLLDPMAPPSTGWLPTRDVSVPGGRLLLEDGDPYRDCYGQPVESRLDGPA
ncbi:FxsB family radical SAM/SPASM domain protein, partial [Micromonospora sp. STR1s_5]|nr:FxsB family radical SAM/SPASM domain protein [Micromonospora sp. STR1s_5]